MSWRSWPTSRAPASRNRPPSKALPDLTKGPAGPFVISALPRQHRAQVTGPGARGLRFGPGIAPRRRRRHFGAHFGDETRRLAGHQLAALFALVAMADGQAGLGAGDANIHQAPLFFQLARFQRVAMRQQALLDADQEDMAELQALGRMQGGELHGIGRAFFLVQHRQQRDRLRELKQVLVLLAALFVQPVDEVADVGPAALGLARFQGFEQPALVADGAHDVVEHLAASPGR